MKTLCFILLAFFSTGVFAAPNTCLPKERVSVLRRYFNIQLNQAPDYCDPQNRAYQIMQALIFIYELQLDGKIPPRPYNQEIIGYDWINRLARLAPSIMWGPSSADAFLCKTSLAMAGSTPGRLDVCPMLFQRNEMTSSLLEIVNTLLHESRHLEGSGYPHTTCVTGQKNACDKSVTYHGAYAVGMEVYAKIGLSATNVHPTLRFLARKLTYVDAQNRFVIPFVQELKNQKVVLLTEKNTGLKQVLNYRYQAPAYTYLPPGRLFSLDSFDFLFAPTDPTLPPQDVGSYEVEAPADQNNSDGLNTYKTGYLYQKASPAERASLKDSFKLANRYISIEASIWGEKIKASVFDKNQGSQKDYEFGLPAGRPDFLRQDGVDEDESKSFLVLNDHDQLFQVQFDAQSDSPIIKEVPNPRPGVIQISQVQVMEPMEAWKKRLDQARAVQNKNKKSKKAARADEPSPPATSITYLLKRDGILYKETIEKGIQPVPEVQNRRFEYMSPEISFSPSIPPDLQE